MQPPQPLLAKEGIKGRSDPMTKIFNTKAETKKRKILRNNMPSSEIILWSRLKDKQLGEYKFRRQFGIGRYVVDFYCPSLKLAIEIDGDSHFSGDAPEYDKERQCFIESLGIKFLRFTNVDIKNNLPHVLEAILHEATSVSIFGTARTPPPQPLLAKEGIEGR